VIHLSTFFTLDAEIETKFDDGWGASPADDNVPAGMPADVYHILSLLRGVIGVYFLFFLLAFRSSQPFETSCHPTK
jgi:hypothetical protein